MPKLVKVTRERNAEAPSAFPWRKVLLVAGAGIAAFFVYRFMKGRK